jgi:hypothetical protein
VSVKNRFFCLILFLAPLALSAAGKDVYDFATSLYDRQEYFRAVSEFQRFAFFEPSDPRISKAGFMIALSYFKAGQFSLAFNSSLTMTNNPRYRFRSRLLAADSLFKLAQYSASAEAYDSISASLTNDRAVVFSRSIWPRLMQKDFSFSLKKYDELLSAWPKWNGRSDIEMLRDSATHLKKFRPLSPPLAGVMSAILPGLGQIYTRRPGDGLVAFAAVAVLGTGSYLLWRYYEHKEIALVVTLAGGFFYAGNIYSAWASANKYNSLYYRKNLEALRDNYWREYDYERE